MWSLAAAAPAAHGAGWGTGLLGRAWWVVHLACVLMWENHMGSEETGESRDGMKSRQRAVLAGQGPPAPLTRGVAGLGAIDV